MKKKITFPLDILLCCNFYKASESGLPGESDFKNYKGLLEKVKETNEKIISDFAIEDEMLKNQ